MSSLDQAVQTQLTNIQKKTGKSLDDLSNFINNSGLSKHGDLRKMVMDNLGLGYGDANALVHYVRKSDGERSAEARGLNSENVIDEIYSGAKASLRPIHDRLMGDIEGFGEFEVAPKKGYVSLRRKKQFAMIGPATKTRVEVGLNMKGVVPSERLLAQPTGSMCNYKVNLSDPADVDGELIDWIRKAYESAG